MSRHPMIQWLAPAVALVAAPAAATTYLTVEQAQQALFPGENLQSQPFRLDAAQAKAVKSASGQRVRDPELHLWRSESGGWMYVDQVLGKHEFITYALALDAEGAVKGLEILDYRETWGGEVRNAAWRAQFNGKTRTAPLKLDVDIVNLSGATLSCRHLADGVRRLLQTHVLVRQTLEQGHGAG